MLKESISRHKSTHQLFDQEVRVGIDDIVIYQEKYEWTFKSWLYGIKIPKWIYHQDPSELLMIRGIIPEILLKEIIDLNYLSRITFNRSYGKYRKLTKLISLLSIIFFLILMAIPSAALRIFLVIMIFGIIIGNIINEIFIQPTETANDDALKAIIKHVQINLNVRYNKNNIRFEIVGRSTLIHHTGICSCFCNNTQHSYYHITLTCIDNVISPRFSSPSHDSEQIQLEVCNSRNVYGQDTQSPENDNATAITKNQNKNTENALPEISELQEDGTQDGLADTPLVPSNSSKQQNKLVKDRPDTPFPAQGQIMNDVNEFMMGLPEVRESEEMIDNKDAPFVIREISDDEDDEEDEDETDEIHDFRDDVDSNSNPKKTRPDTLFPNMRNKNQRDDIVAPSNGLPRIPEVQERNHDAYADNVDLEKEDQDDVSKKDKDYHYNWAQNVGRKRESWIDPHADAKNKDMQPNE